MAESPQPTPARRSQAHAAQERDQARELSGMANVGALTFLAARAVPLGWTVGVAGGVPLARAAERHGGRAGYATAMASLVETMAIMGPARMGIPVPHAASAPLLGLLVRRRSSLLTMAIAGAAVRTGYYALTSAFSIIVLIGLDGYLGSYERLRHSFGFLPAGDAAALWLTFASLVVWSLGAGVIQAWVIRRGLRRWTAEESVAAPAQPRSERPAEAQARPHALAFVGLAISGFAAALASTDARALGVIGAVLAIAWTFTAAGWRTLARGLALALPLALSTLAFGLVGGIGAGPAARRASRVALLVLIAVWLHSAAGSQGLRAVSLRLVRLLRRVPTLALVGTVLGASVSAVDFGGAARRLGGRMRSVARRPTPILDASLAWLADESSRLAGPEADRANCDAPDR